MGQGPTALPWAKPWGMSPPQHQCRHTSRLLPPQPWLDLLDRSRAYVGSRRTGPSSWSPALAWGGEVTETDTPHMCRAPTPPPGKWAILCPSPTGHSNDPTGAPSFLQCPQGCTVAPPGGAPSPWRSPERAGGAHAAAGQLVGVGLTSGGVRRWKSCSGGRGTSAAPCGMPCQYLAGCWAGLWVTPSGLCL